MIYQKSMALAAIAWALITTVLVAGCGGAASISPVNNQNAINQGPSRFCNPSQPGSDSTGCATPTTGDNTNSGDQIGTGITANNAAAVTHSALQYIESLYDIGGVGGVGQAMLTSASPAGYVGGTDIQDLDVVVLSLGLLNEIRQLQLQAGWGERRVVGAVANPFPCTAGSAIFSAQSGADVGIDFDACEWNGVTLTGNLTVQNFLYTVVNTSGWEMSVSLSFGSLAVTTAGATVSFNGVLDLNSNSDDGVSGSGALAFNTSPLAVLYEDAASNSIEVGSNVNYNFNLAQGTVELSLFLGVSTSRWGNLNIATVLTEDALGAINGVSEYTRGRLNISNRDGGGSNLSATLSASGVTLELGGNGNPATYTWEEIRNS